MFSVFVIIMTCILDNAGHVIIGFTMPTSEARWALLYFDHEEEGSNSNAEFVQLHVLH